LVDIGLSSVEWRRCKEREAAETVQMFFVGGDDDGKNYDGKPRTREGERGMAGEAMGHVYRKYGRRKNA
jgi:hypothetical protein